MKNYLLLIILLLLTGCGSGGGIMPPVSQATPTAAATITPLPTISPVPSMVKVTGGTFQMGSSSGDSDEQPLHNVQLSDFYISPYEVSNREYCDFLNSEGNQMESTVHWVDIRNDNYCGIKQDGEKFSIVEGYEKRPVVYVSWYGAVAYCNWLSQKNGLQQCYGTINYRTYDHKKNGYRLPTEAEWEYACRGGTNTAYYWGDIMDPDYCWYFENSENNHHDTGLKLPNSLGIYDMSGNVWEWCYDVYGSYSAGILDNPTGPDNGIYNILRGGSWYYGSGLCRSANRNYGSPENQSAALGFRIVKNL